MEKQTDLLVKDVADLVAEGSKTVRSAIVKTLADKEVALRTSCTLECLEKLKQEKNKLNKIKPDNVVYTESGAETKTFSKAKFEERKKCLELIEKLEAAIDLAFNKNDFTKVKELSGKSKEEVKEDTKE